MIHLSITEKRIILCFLKFGFSLQARSINFFLYADTWYLIFKPRLSSFTRIGHQQRFMQLSLFEESRINQVNHINTLSPKSSSLTMNVNNDTNKSTTRHDSQPLIHTGNGYKSTCVKVTMCREKPAKYMNITHIIGALCALAHGGYTKTR